MSSHSLICTKQLSRDYPVGVSHVRAIDRITLEFGQGEFIAVMGASGSGKSTLMHLMGLLDTPTSGHVYFEGIDTSGLTTSERALMRNSFIGFVFQAYHLLPRASALDNVALPLLYSNVDSTKHGIAARQALSRVQLAHRTGHLPNMLSGGEQQRVAIARALVNHPKLLLADEPTGALDSATGKDILTLLKEIQLSGTTVVLVTHDESVAQSADRLVKMRDGRIMSDVTITRNSHEPGVTSMSPGKLLSTVHPAENVTHTIDAKGVYQPDIDLGNTVNPLAISKTK